MRKQLVLFLFAVIFAIAGASAANKAYVALTESPLYILNEREVVVETLPDKVAKGDTVYATSQTLKFLEEHKGERILRMPIEYRDIKAFIYVDNIHPIRLEASDTLTYLSDSKVEKGSFREQKIIPAMEWAMNVTNNPMQWIYIALISIACALVFNSLLKVKGLGLIALVLVGISLSVMSVAELMYYLSYEPHALWFLKSSIVNGWGHVILNFMILSVVLACQASLFYNVWDQSFTIYDPLAIRIRWKKDEFDDDSEDEDESHVTPQWINNLVFIPFLIGVLLIIIFLFNESEIIYKIIGYLISGAALISAIYQFSKGRILPGMIFPLCYLIGSVGIILMIFTLSYVMVIAAIVGAIFFAIASFALSLIIGVIKGPEKVAFVDKYGKLHTGSRYFGGKAKSDQDGKMYDIGE